MTVLRQHTYIQLYDITLITTFSGGQIDIKKKRIVSLKLFLCLKKPFFQFGFCDGKTKLTILLVKLLALQLFNLILDSFYCNAFSYFLGEMQHEIHFISGTDARKEFGKMHTHKIDHIIPFQTKCRIPRTECTFNVACSYIHF